MTDKKIPLAAIRVKGGAPAFIGDARLLWQAQSGEVMYGCAQVVAAKIISTTVADLIRAEEKIEAIQGLEFISPSCSGAVAR